VKESRARKKSSGSWPGLGVIRLSDHRKNKRKARPSATDKTQLKSLPAADKYGGQISRELAIELLERAKRHIVHIPFPDSWPEIDKMRWLNAAEMLDQKVVSLRPNTRQVLLPRLYPERPGSASREFEYVESAKRAMEVIHEILEIAELECGEEFRKRLNRAILKTLRRTDAPRLTKPSWQVNLEIIRILGKFVEARSSGKEEPLLKELAPGPDADRWAHDASVKLTRFCERVYRVWQQFPGVPLERIEQICFIPNAKDAFLVECSLEFPRHAEIAREAIRHREQLTEKRRQRKQRKLLKTRPTKPVRRK